MIRRASCRAVLAAGALGVLAAPSSPAHEVDPSIVTVIDGVVPPVPGIEVTVATSVTTQLIVVNETDEPLEVLAITGEPFVRIGPAGVEANLASPSWYLTNQPFGASGPPSGTSPDAPPRWATVSTERSWGWFDHRLHPEAVTSVLGEDRNPTFEVPMRLGDTDLVVRGHLEQRRSAPTFRAELLAVPAADSGLGVQLLQGRAPGLFVRYDGTGTVVVEGADGEPFLRLGAGGAEVNRRSPTWVFTAQAQGTDLAGVAADATAVPDWQQVSPSPSFAWIDPRALIAEVGDEAQTLEWVVPVTIDGQPADIRGATTVDLVELTVPDEVPVTDTGDDRPWLVPAVVVSAGLTGVVVWRLARSRGSSPRLSR